MYLTLTSFNQCTIRYDSNQFRLLELFRNTDHTRPHCKNKLNVFNALEKYALNLVFIFEPAQSCAYPIE